MTTADVTGAGWTVSGTSGHHMRIVYFGWREWIFRESCHDCMFHWALIYMLESRFM